ncbi:hypothetical protein FLONG3_6314 [Fusarium longipes]|uniref:Uncharacterized protein n=1 Tax=Fusarium longipes TaxID=694270 RepID=A0A395SN67_9HYPO|nr:hypothetical protein FLONG3_6314 [Fusarium longipes]
MSSALTTQIFMPPFNLYLQNTPIATVISANPTATTLQIACLDKGCSGPNVNNTVVVGPWADETVTKGAASTGTFHWMVSMADFGLSSIECLVSSGTPQACTTTVSMDDEALTKTATGLGDITRALELSFSSVPVVITKGQDLLSVHATATATKESTSAQTTDSESAMGDEPTATESSTDAAQPRESNGAGSSAVRVISTMIMAGLASAIVHC